MKWFKHDSDANMDFKMQTLMLDYGLEGYGLYWYCLELIAGKIEEDNISFELEHDARIIARNTGSTVQRVEEMMRKFVDLGLFENNDGTITCLKLRQRLDKSMTSNPYLRKLITNLKVDNEQYSGYVYFILAENETVKRIKIGRSKNPHARINDLKKRDDCIGLNLSILFTKQSDDCVSLETEMHRKFKSLNIKDEWFEYSDDILNYIESLRTDYVSTDKIRLDKIRKDNTRGTRLPKDWQPSAEYIDFCKQERPDLNPENIAKEFKDYWIAVAGSAGVKNDWLATWRNWVRRQRAPVAVKETFGWRNDDTLVLKKAAALGIYTSGKSRFEILAAIGGKEGRA